MGTTPGTEPTPRTFKQKLLVWVWNAINASMGGAATGGLAILGGAAIGAASYTPRQILSNCLAGAGVALFMYIRSNRLPEMFDGEGN